MVNIVRFAGQCEVLDVQMTVGCRAVKSTGYADASLTGTGCVNASKRSVIISLRNAELKMPGFLPVHVIGRVEQKVRYAADWRPVVFCSQTDGEMVALGLETAHGVEILLFGNAVAF